jgi:hypothetical protein
LNKSLVRNSNGSQSFTHSDVLYPNCFFLSFFRWKSHTPSGQTSEVLLRVSELHRLRRDPLRDISRKSKPPSAWIQGRNTRHIVRCVRARTNVCSVRRELRSHSTRSVGASSHSIKCCAIELHQVSLRLTSHNSETNLRGLVVLDASGYNDTIRESQKCFQYFHWKTVSFNYSLNLNFKLRLARCLWTMS